MKARPKTMKKKTATVVRKARTAKEALPFWKTKTLEQMTPKEWESLCDGCGKCCTYKLEYEETGELAQTNVACRLFDGTSCQCSDYKNRKKIVPDCMAWNMSVSVPSSAFGWTSTVTSGAPSRAGRPRSQSAGAPAATSAPRSMSPLIPAAGSRIAKRPSAIDL